MSLSFLLLRITVLVLGVGTVPRFFGVTLMLCEDGTGWGP